MVVTAMKPAAVLKPRSTVEGKSEKYVTRDYAKRKAVQRIRKPRESEKKPPSFNQPFWLKVHPFQLT